MASIRDTIKAATLAAVAAALADAFQVRERLTVDQWAGLHRRIPERGNPEPGPWQNDRTPFTVEPMRACSDPTVRQVSAMKGSQLGFTDALVFNRLGWAIDQDPGPELIIYPNDRLARSTVKTRLRPSIKASPTLAAKYSAGKAESSMEVLVFTTMDVSVCGSNSATNIRSKPYRRVTIDDFDLCEPSTYEEGTQRTGAFEALSPLITCVGTPGFWEKGIHAQYLNGDRRRYLCPCPHCGHFQEWLFENLTWSGGIAADPGQVLESAFMRCVACKGRIENALKPWCLSWGCWQPDGVDVVLPEHLRAPGAFREWTRTVVGHDVGFLHPALSTKGEAAHPSKGHRSYRISSLYSPFQPFGWVAEGFINSGGRPERDWVNGKLGQPWRVRGEDVSLERVRSLCKPVELGGYVSGTVPAGVIILVTAVDVGADHVSMLTVGATERMKQLAWIDGRRIEAPKGFLPALASEVLAKLNYPHLAGGMMRPALFFVDSQHRSREVYDLCLALGPSLAYPVKGMGPTAESWKIHEFDTGPSGEHLGNSLKRLAVCTNYWSEAIFARLYASVGETPEGDALSIAEPDTLLLPCDLSDADLRQWTSEECVKGVWQKKPGREDNHFIDDLRYAEAGLTMGAARMMTTEVLLRDFGVPRWLWTPGDIAPHVSPITTAQRRVNQPDSALARRVSRRTRS